MDDTQPTEPQTIYVHSSNIGIGGSYLFQIMSVYIYIYTYVQYIYIYIHTAYIISVLYTIIPDLCHMFGDPKKICATLAQPPVDLLQKFATVADLGSTQTKWRILLFTIHFAGHNIFWKWGNPHLPNRSLISIYIYIYIHTNIYIYIYYTYIYIYIHIIIYIHIYIYIYILCVCIYIYVYCIYLQSPLGNPSPPVAQRRKMMQKEFPSAAQSQVKKLKGSSFRGEKEETTTNLMGMGINPPWIFVEYITHDGDITNGYQSNINDLTRFD